jgi:hypothetical protein
MTRSNLEIVASVAFGLAAALTVVVPDWIEAVFHVDPDGGIGALEWVIVAGLGALAMVAGWLARRDRVLGRSRGQPT